MGDDAPPRGEAFAREIVPGRDEVGEGIDLLLALALLVPAIAFVLAAADMSDGVDKAAIDEAQRIGGEAGGNGHAIGAVAIEQKRRLGTERGVLAIQQRNWNGLSVLRRGHHPAGHVVRRIVAARDFLGFAQDALARLHVIVEHLRRRRHRGIGEAQRARVVFVAGRHAERVRLLGEGDVVLGAVGETAHNNARQPIFAFEPDEVVLERDHVEDQPPRPMRLDLAPMLAARTVDRRFDDAVILGAV